MPKTDHHRQLPYLGRVGARGIGSTQNQSKNTQLGLHFAAAKLPGLRTGRVIERTEPASSAVPPLIAHALDVAKASTMLTKEPTGESK